MNPIKPMTSRKFEEQIADCPIIAAVKDDTGLERALASDARVIFVLYGNVCGIGGIAGRIREAGRAALVHIDLVAGLSNSKEVSVDFIRETTAADGIITTRGPLVRRAKELGLLAVQRFFLLDSLSLESVRRPRDPRPDFIEVLPGLMPKVIRRVAAGVPEPLIAGGLITEKEDVMAALTAGASAVSTTNEEVWFL